MKRFPMLASVLAVAALCTLGSSARALPAPAAGNDMADMAEVFSAQSLPPSDLLPAPVLKCGPICFAGVHTTATISGSGSSCTAAQTSLNSQLANIATGYCVNTLGDLGTCTVVEHNTTACTLIGTGTYQIQGYETYHCRDSTC